MISLVIPVTSDCSDYTTNLVNNIRELYPNENDVEVIVHNGECSSLGDNWNEAVAKAAGEKIIILHNDMVLKPGFVETMDKHIARKRLTTYTRIEPPIYPDTFPGKMILDCGYDLTTFDKNKFNSLPNEDYLIDGGAQIFIGCYKEDYIGIDGTTFKMFCEDDDLHLRYNLLGYEKKVSSACVYHFVSKTSRAIKDYQAIEHISNINFIRKWGFRSSQYNKKYNVGFIVKNCTQELLIAIEPWCTNIACDVDPSLFLKLIQPTTKFNLSKKIKPIDTQLENDVIITFDASKIVDNSLNLISTIADSLTHNNVEVGKFEYDIYQIEVRAVNTYEDKLIKTNDPYFLNQLL